MRSFIRIQGNSSRASVIPMTVKAMDGDAIDARVERMKEKMGLRWTEAVDCDSTGLSVEVTVHSDGFGWEAFSSDPPLFCHGRTPADALGFYRFCLSEYAKGRLRSSAIGERIRLSWKDNIQICTIVWLLATITTQKCLYICIFK